MSTTVWFSTILLQESRRDGGSSSAGDLRAVAVAVAVKVFERDVEDGVHGALRAHPRHCGGVEGCDVCHDGRQAAAAGCCVALVWLAPRSSPSRPSLSATKPGYTNSGRCPRIHLVVEGGRGRANSTIARAHVAPGKADSIPSHSRAHVPKAPAALQAGGRGAETYPTNSCNFVVGSGTNMSMETRCLRKRMAKSQGQD